MAKEKRKFNKHLALMCIVPVLVLVITMSIMGVTFAWFNDAEQTTIATLSLSTTQIFEMTFEIQSTTPENDERYVYKGQTAYDSGGMLVTDVHAREIMGYEQGNDMYNMYILDKAFVAPFDLKLDTNIYNEKDEMVKRNKVNFTCEIESVHIYNEDNEAIEITLPTNSGTPDDTSDDITPEDIKLGFTWYISDSLGQVWHTPYGTIYASQPAGMQSNGDFKAGPIVTNDWDTSISIKDFYATKTERYTFNIVFAPEKLFWKQYGNQEDYMQSAYDIYGDVYGKEQRSEKWNAINRYSLLVYSGSTYSFNVLLTVNSVTEVNN